MSVSPPRGAAGWSVYCNSDILWSDTFVFRLLDIQNKGALYLPEQ